MQLKKLDMQGFKSFAGRTQIVFEEGITGVVGPNGCGKSNIVDAVRWVLGTMSYRSVRGDEMMDVIFKGAPGAAPTGFAAVSLTLDNSDKTLDIDYDEVVITRRLHRDGTSEYLINEQQVRLRDVRDLLYGTGIGTDNYSIVEQGKIDKLVMSNPRERRLVFDEAAGISKYRARRHETQLRLNRVEQDLLRLQDILREVQRELHSVRIQAGRAQKYRQIQEEYRDKRLRLTLHENESIRVRRREIESRREEIGRTLVGLEERLRAKREEAEGLEGDLRAMDERYARIASALASAESKEEYLRKSVDQGGQRLEELAGAEERARKTLEGHEFRLKEQEEQERKFREEAEEARAGVVRLEAEVAEMDARVGEARAECRRLEEELERKRAEAVELAHKEAGHRTEAARVEEERSSLEARLGRVRARVWEDGEEHSDVLMKLYGVDEQIEKAETALKELQGMYERETRAIEELKGERVGLDARIKEVRSLRDSGKARVDTLRDLESQREGLGAGTRRLLEQREEGVLGTFADLVEVDPAWLSAVENVLGDRAAFVVCRDDFSAERAAEQVRDLNGRTGILSLESCSGNGAHLVEGPGVVGRAADFVRSAEEHRAAVESLLGATWIVEDAAAARALRGAGATLVTREGECYEACGAVRVGRAGGAGLLSRKAELRKLEGQIEEAAAVLARAEERCAGNAKRARTAEEKTEMLRRQIYEQKVAESDANARREQLEKRRLFLEEEILALNGEVMEIDGHRGTLAVRARNEEGLVGKAAELRAQVESEIETDGGTSRKYRDELSRLREEATAMRVRRGQEEEKAAALEQRVEGLSSDLSYVREAARRSREEIEEIGARRETVAEERESNRRDLEGMAGEMEGLRAQVSEVDESRGRQGADMERVRGGIAELEQEGESARTTLQDLRVELTEQRAHEQNLVQRAREEYGIELDGDELPAPEGEEPGDWTAFAEEVEKLRVRIQKFGSVNMAALDTLESLEAREVDLRTQKEDLETAKRRLEELIRKLNRESRELFDRTLAEVREHFSAIFRKLYGGGKADIVVEEQEGVDPMDQGLEIMVKPPNKEISTLRLLSGGERSLTAIALVMALFKANPSPFCILDEADGALDETNVSKFTALLRDLAAETQFIVITHNQRTMGTVDVLYGVSMPSPGISKKVKVDLRGGENLDIVRQAQAEKRAADAGLEANVGTSTTTAVLEPGD
ncbi:MAG: chromosome segregation protein SMC [Planctomycetota bacterium]|jgi:chromosome segregation protein